MLSKTATVDVRYVKATEPVGQGVNRRGGHILVYLIKLDISLSNLRFHHDICWLFYPLLHLLQFNISYPYGHIGHMGI